MKVGERRAKRMLLAEQDDARPGAPAVELGERQAAPSGTARRGVAAASVEGSTVSDAAAPSGPGDTRRGRRRARTCSATRPVALAQRAPRATGRRSREAGPARSCARPSVTRPRRGRSRARSPARGRHAPQLPEQQRPRDRLPAGGHHHVRAAPVLEPVVRPRRRRSPKTPRAAAHVGAAAADATAGDPRARASTRARVRRSRRTRARIVVSPPLPRRKGGTGRRPELLLARSASVRRPSEGLVPPRERLRSPRTARGRAGDRALRARLRPRRSITPASRWCPTAETERPLELVDVCRANPPSRPSQRLEITRGRSRAGAPSGAARPGPHSRPPRRPQPARSRAERDAGSASPRAASSGPVDLTVRGSLLRAVDTATEPLQRRAGAPTTWSSGSSRRSSSNAPSPHIVWWKGFSIAQKASLGTLSTTVKPWLRGSSTSSSTSGDEVCEVLDDLEARDAPTRRHRPRQRVAHRSQVGARREVGLQRRCSARPRTHASAWRAASSVDVDEHDARPARRPPGPAAAAIPLPQPRSHQSRRAREISGARHRVARPRARPGWPGSCRALIRSCQSGPASELLRDPRRLAVEVARIRPRRSGRSGPAARARARRCPWPRRRLDGSGRSPRDETAG